MKLRNSIPIFAFKASTFEVTTNDCSLDDVDCDNVALDNVAQTWNGVNKVNGDVELKAGSG